MTQCNNVDADQLKRIFDMS